MTEASQELRVNASTAYRLLVTLALDGFATQAPDRRYTRGHQFEDLFPKVNERSLASRLRPALEALFEMTGETVHVATLVGTRIQHIDGIEATSHPLRFGLRVGVWLPAHISAGGQALLANFSEREVNARYEMALSGPRGRNLDVSLDALHEQLQDVRETRIAWNFEQTEPGIAALAISTREIDGQRAALSIGAPISRFSKGLGEQWSAALIETVDGIGSLAD